MMDKADIRRKMRRLKAEISPEQRLKEAELVFSRLEATDEFRRSRRIMLYDALPDELPTAMALARWQETKQLFLPRVCGDDIEVLPFRGREMMQSGAFHIQEPTGNDLVDPATLDLIVVPGVAFDTACNRLGRGRGYYDRLLSRTPAITIGVCFDCQLLSTPLPTEPHDRPLHLVISPSAIKQQNPIA